jgi:hypothetical protein
MNESARLQPHRSRVTPTSTGDDAVRRAFDRHFASLVENARAPIARA